MNGNYKPEQGIQAVSDLINSYAAALSLTFNKQTSKQVNKHVINDESSLEW